MIQRKQTIFLLVSLILTVICLCLPVGTFSGTHPLGTEADMYNLWIVLPAGSHDYSVWVLFAILLITCPITLVGIFSYHNRIVQSRYCMFNMLLILGWYVVYGVLAVGMTDYLGDFNISFAAVLPLICLILYFMARRAILADEALVRASDRIR